MAGMQPYLFDNITISDSMSVKASLLVYLLFSGGKYVQPSSIFSSKLRHSFDKMTHRTNSDSDFGNDKKFSIEDLNTMIIPPDFF